MATDWLTRVLRRLALFSTLFHERRHLRRLDADQLRDVGLAPHDAAQEAARPPWSVPEARRADDQPADTWPGTPAVSALQSYRWR